MVAKLTRSVLDSVSGGTLSFGGLIKQLANSPTRGKTEHEMIEDVFWFNCMGTDGIPGRPFNETSGQFSLDGSGKLTLAYKPGSRPTDHPVFSQIEKILQAFATQMKGEYVAFPLWGGLFGKKKLAVTHPLGGCPMGHSSTDGVVDTAGRVFNTSAGADSVHPGLYIMDGAIVPGPVAVNPTLTIVTLSLKVVQSVTAYLQKVGIPS